MRYFNSLLYNKTVRPIMLRSQIIYGHRTASIYFTLPAAGRIVRNFVLFLDIIRCPILGYPGVISLAKSPLGIRGWRCPVKFSYYLKFHGALTAFCRVIDGTMTSAGHHLHTSDGHRTIFVWNSNRTISTAAGHRTMCEKSKELSKISIQMFYESNCHRWEATCICRSTYWICIDISLVKTKSLN